MSDIIDRVLEDVEGKKMLLDAAMKYLWVSGKGCNGINVWSYLPKDLIVYIMNIYEHKLHSYDTIYADMKDYRIWCLIDKRTNELTRKCYKFKTNMKFTSKGLIETYSYLIKPFIKENLDHTWTGFIYILLQNTHFDKTKFFNSISNCIHINSKNAEYRKSQTLQLRHNSWSVLHKLIQYFLSNHEIYPETRSANEYYLRLFCSFFRYQNPVRDSYTMYLLILKLANTSYIKLDDNEHEYKKSITIYTLLPSSEEYIEIMRTGSIRDAYNGYIQLAEQYGIKMPKIIMSDEIDQFVNKNNKP